MCHNKKEERLPVSWVCGFRGMWSLGTKGPLSAYGQSGSVAEGTGSTGLPTPEAIQFVGQVNPLE